ncbi:Ig-like domain-containing protein, partial [Flavobacterium sp. 9R]|uniref:Ig-like domain-containing protein n=1 Tax=Flavobacterium sp. 9R TaxID=2653143 RepID=UPI0019163D1B
QAICISGTTTFSSTVTGGSWSSSDTAIATVNSSTGVVTGVTAGTATITYTVTGTGGCANVTANLDVMVGDTTAPVVPTLADVTGQCSVTPTAPTTTDACSGTITGTTITVFPITTQGTTVVTWSFDDGNGQVVTANQNIILGPLPSAPQVDVVVAQCNILGTVKITNYDSSSLYSFIPSGPIVGADGTVTGVVNGVSYEVLVTNSNNCNSLPTTFSQASFICANDDTIASTGGNVLSNDTLNGAAVSTTNTDVTPITTGPLSIDADGNLTVAPNTPSGTYTITYELCEVGATPANCDTAIATVVVGNPIVANDDTIASTGGNVLSNDTLNGAAVSTSNTDVTPITTGPLSIDANGDLTVAPNTPSGTYTITYELCEVGATPANCDTAIA